MRSVRAVLLIVWVMGGCVPDHGSPNTSSATMTSRGPATIPATTAPVAAAKSPLAGEWSVVRIAVDGADFSFRLLFSEDGSEAELWATGWPYRVYLNRSETDAALYERVPAGDDEKWSILCDAITPVRASGRLFVNDATYEIGLSRSKGLRYELEHVAGSDGVEFAVGRPGVLRTGSYFPPMSGKPVERVVIFINGSGQGTRDYYGIWGTIGKHLLDENIAYAVMDSIGAGGSSQASWLNRGIDEEVKDVRAAIDWVHGQFATGEQPKITLVGHSRGGQVALTVANRENDIDRVVCLMSPIGNAWRSIASASRRETVRTAPPEIRDRLIDLLHESSLAGNNVDKMLAILKQVRTLCEGAKASPDVIEAMEQAASNEYVSSIHLDRFEQIKWDGGQIRWANAPIIFVLGKYDNIVWAGEQSAAFQKLGRRGTDRMIELPVDHSLRRPAPGGPCTDAFKRFLPRDEDIAPIVSAIIGDSQPSGGRPGR